MPPIVSTPLINYESFFEKIPVIYERSIDRCSDQSIFRIFGRDERFARYLFLLSFTFAEKREKRPKPFE